MISVQYGNRLGMPDPCIIHFFFLCGKHH